MKRWNWTSKLINDNNDQFKILTDEVIAAPSLFTFCRKSKLLEMFSRNRRTKVAALDKGRRSDQSRVNKIDDFQPKILRKPETKINLDEKNSEVQKLEVEAMTRSVKLIIKNRLDLNSLLSFLDLENSNFYVVGVIGMKCSGKTTIMNLIAKGEYKLCTFDKTFYIENYAFGGSHNNGIEAFITKDRVFLLDSAPINYNESGREFIHSEADDIRLVQALFRLCHELVIIYESNQITNLIRMLICAKQMMSENERDEPFVTLVENRVQPGCLKSSMTAMISKHLANNISDSINSIQLPDIRNVSYYRDDPKEIISKLRDDINTRKELKAFDEPTETEKSWSEKFSKINLVGGPLMIQFEALRERFYQPNEVSS